MTYKKLLWLGATALASLGLYLWLALRYPLIPSLVDPRASWATLVGLSGWNVGQHLAVYLGLILLYLTGLRLLTPSQGESRIPARQQVLSIIAAWLAFSGALMAVAPAGESHDIFDYLFRGRMMEVYHANPLAEVPSTYSAAPYNLYLAWQENVDTYGPLWEATSLAVASGVHRVAQMFGWWDERLPSCPRSPGSCRLLVLYLIAYRILAIGLTGISGILIASMVRRSQPLYVPLALAVWLWCPLTLITTALGAHNDALLILFFLLCLWLLQRERLVLALIMLVLAAHVKLTALIWIPPILLWIVWRWGWRRALKVSLASAACGLALSWLLYMPFGGWQTLPRMLYERSQYLANSPWRVLKALLASRWHWSLESAQRLVVRLSSGLFAIGGVLISLWIFGFGSLRGHSQPVASSESDRKLSIALLGVSVCYLLVGSFWYEHWYVIWALTPAALLPDGRFTRNVLPWLAFGSLSANVAMDFLLRTLMKDAPPIYGYTSSVTIIWLPAMMAAMIQLLSNQRRLVEAPSTGVTV